MNPPDISPLDSAVASLERAAAALAGMSASDSLTRHVRAGVAHDFLTAFDAFVDFAVPHNAAFGGRMMIGRHPDRDAVGHFSEEFGMIDRNRWLRYGEVRETIGSSGDDAHIKAIAAEAVAFARDAREFVVRARKQMEEGEVHE